MKLGEFTNPFTGHRGNILDPGNWLNYILGVAFLFIIFSFGQQFARMAADWIPGAGTRIDSPIRMPDQNDNDKPSRRHYGV